MYNISLGRTGKEGFSESGGANEIWKISRN